MKNLNIDQNKDVELDELEKLVQDIEIQSAVALARSAHDGNPKHHQEMIKNSIAKFNQIITQKCLEARVAGFRDARIACSFNSNCNQCRANKLSLNYLGKPEAQLKQRKASK